MPAYVVALIHAITDPDAYARYVAQVQATLDPFGGRFIARKPGPDALEGGPAPARGIVLEFPSEDHARRWHASPSYQPVMRLRQSASQGTLILLPGYLDGMARVAIGDVCYVEMVAADVDAAVQACEAAHGWRFAPPDGTLGGARLARLASGALAAIRAPLHDAEAPVTRAYVRVADISAATAAAEKAGAFLALSEMSLGEHGRIAIWIVGGIEMGAWELPAAGRG